VKETLPRLLRILTVAAAAWLAYIVLDSLGLGWLLLPAGLVLTLAIALYRYRRVKKHSTSAGRAERWMAAALDDGERPKAIEEARRAVDSYGKVTERNRAERARLMVVYAELLDADDQGEAAGKVLETLELEGLSLAERALVCHCRAAHGLRMGDLETAFAATEQAPARCGSPGLDLRLELIRAAVVLEQDPEGAHKALDTSMHVRRRAGGDAALIVEARVLRAAAMDAMGNRSDALDIIGTLGQEVIGMLVRFGQPRVQALANEAMDRSND